MEKNEFSTNPNVNSNSSDQTTEIGETGEDPDSYHEIRAGLNKNEKIISDSSESDIEDDDNNNKNILVKNNEPDHTQILSDSELIAKKIYLRDESKRVKKIIDKFDHDYDNQIEFIADKATSLIADGSFLNCGLYQFISFVFISIAWTVGNGWYAYFSVFQGFTPNHECDLKSMNLSTDNYSVIDKCSVLNNNNNETIKCTHWIYDKSEMENSMITDYDLVCDNDYVFELAYSLEQIGYVVGTLLFSFIADKVGRKPVLVIVTAAMALLGLAQHFVTNLIAFFVLGFIINSLACVSKLE